MLTTRRLYRTTIALALAGALLAPAASSADPPPHVVPSPDAAANDAAAARIEAGQDLRSPDTRDAAMGRGTWSVPDVTVVKLSEPVPVAESGMDWGDAGLGAGTVSGVILVGLAGALAVVHRRRRGPRTATAA